MTQVDNWTEIYKGTTITAEGPLFRAIIGGVVTRKPSVAAMRKAIEKAAFRAVPVTPVEVLNVARNYGVSTSLPRIIIASGFHKGGRIRYIDSDKREVLYHDGLYNPATFPLKVYTSFVERQQKLQEEWSEFVRRLPLPLSSTEISQRMQAVPEEGQEK